MVFVLQFCGTVGFELDMARKEINKTQKLITEKKKVSWTRRRCITCVVSYAAPILS